MSFINDRNFESFSSKIKYLTILLLLILLFIFNCEPPRDNPYDPKSVNVKFSEITGRITTKVGNPISDVRVFLVLDKISNTVETKSDSEGNYNLKYRYDLQQGDSARLIVSKDNYQEVQRAIQIDVNKHDTLNFILDAMPIFMTESIFTIHERLFFPGDIYSVTFSTQIIDYDGIGDIESVYVIIPLLEKKFTLNYYPPNVYRITLPCESFPDASLECLIGVDCYFEVVGQTKIRNRSNAQRVSRIIYETAEQIYPYGDTVNNNFTFIWHSVSLPYPFVYGVEIYMLNGLIPQLFYSSAAITDTFVSITIPPQSAITQYFWQVLIRDNYNNISKSNQVLFYINYP
ncbi:MAG: carboxypeptidase-like regulatory domain-containing protein [candidate division WOR-3 bacterium]